MADPNPNNPNAPKPENRAAPQHPAPGPGAVAPAVGVQNRPVEPLKNTKEGTAPDPAANVADPAVAGKTNPGPGANEDRPSLPNANAPVTSGALATRNAPNQPVVPAPSENVFPGPVGRPDPSRSPEERQAVADAAIEAHGQRPGHLTSNEGVAERTSDGEPDNSSVPTPSE